MTEPQTAEARLREHLRRMDMSYTERFEDGAERFYQQTGFLAPGKSVPLAMGGYDEDERERAWAAFQLKERDVFRADLTEAIEALVRSAAHGSDTGAAHHASEGGPLAETNAADVAQIQVKQGQAVWVQWLRDDHSVASAQLVAEAGPQAPREEPGPIALNPEQREAATLWAADDRLWTTQEVVAFNLKIFARKILSLEAGVSARVPEEPHA